MSDPNRTPAPRRTLTTKDRELIRALATWLRGTLEASDFEAVADVVDGRCTYRITCPDADAAQALEAALARYARGEWTDTMEALRFIDRITIAAKRTAESAQPDEVRLRDLFEAQQERNKEIAEGVRNPQREH